MILEIPAPTAVFSFVIDEQLTGRLDKGLVSYNGAYSRAFYQQQIELGRVRVNGRVYTRVSHPLSLGDVVEVELIEEEEPSSLIPEDIPLDKVYEDDMILVINKPRDMVVHPAPGHTQGTVVHALLHEIGERLKQEFPEEPWRPGIVHRLDKDTSGLLITVKTRRAKALYSELFATKQVKKLYVAICINAPSQELIHTRITRHPLKRKEMTVLSTHAEGGKEAITHCHVLATNGRLSVVALYPETGRTHQLRVHMKHLGTPILGDPVYGIPSINFRYGLDKQQLHAYSLVFAHPESAERVKLVTKLPDDMTSLIEKEFREGVSILDGSCDWFKITR
ncbi:RluA family pseudouridine synthase [Chlamydia trachomatis]|uniref:Pseudouridine synthase n=2 Tax=Chlamydia trachomatis TaxID=813 RepID=A0A6H2W277_CHLTB|nr:ribosomal large subunit pseudouridine synthase D [Chlamydia trachomatis L2c]AGJ64111.1 ribosomal large subunit pseudouridine synthase D [Chlamydia trachomatis L2/434/Bu(i)]AGJ65051.1 ribosomal large subunit pseudouridine synthase D [Chlamydia trachomatis L2/434/Bu(f)]AGR95022.1 ribosomal large subunit pseudouridine synthase D [Chlamydia trachomatis RC-L2(s)/46]AGR98743.1 ribosomal large subunit pseudouridine synthase D [Chlamydia trachomatis RC-L2(s)/3]AGS04363.1 ribosomal large subunit pse